MMNLDEAITMIEVETTSKVTVEDTPDDQGRVLLTLQRGSNTFKINVERTRLRQLKSGDYLMETLEKGLTTAI